MRFMEFHITFLYVHMFFFLDAKEFCTSAISDLDKY